MKQQLNDAVTTSATYSIGDLAKEFDLTTRAMRFYEDMGLLQPLRTGPGGRSRLYSARDRARLKLTLRAKRLGLSLLEAREIIDCYDSPHDTIPQLHQFLAVLASHREKLQTQLQDLKSNLDEIHAHEKAAKTLLAKTVKTPKPSKESKPEKAKKISKSEKISKAEKPSKKRK